MTATGMGRGSGPEWAVTREATGVASSAVMTGETEKNENDRADRDALATVMARALQQSRCNIRKQRGLLIL